jgi:transposase
MHNAVLAVGLQPTAYSNLQEAKAGIDAAVPLDMRAYSTDLKERLVRAVAAGQPMREAARRFGVAVTTVKRAVVQQRETGSLERRPIPGGPRRIGKDQEAILLTRLQAAPDATVLEHCAWWAEQSGQELSEATMWRAIRRLGWTHKKRHWQPVNATRKRAQPGARQSLTSTHSSSSSSTRAAQTLP